MLTVWSMSWAKRTVSGYRVKRPKTGAIPQRHYLSSLGQRVLFTLDDEANIGLMYSVNDIEDEARRLAIRNKSNRGKGICWNPNLSYRMTLQVRDA